MPLHQNRLCIQSFPSRKKALIPCKSHKALKAPRLDPSRVQHQQGSATQICTDQHNTLLRLAAFLFLKWLGYKICNCCYYSWLEGSRKVCHIPSYQEEERRSSCCTCYVFLLLYFSSLGHALAIPVLCCSTLSPGP